MGRLTILAALSVLTLFMFLWYQEELCASTVLCSGFHPQTERSHLNRHENIFRVIPSVQSARRNSVWNSDEPHNKSIRTENSSGTNISASKNLTHVNEETSLSVPIQRNKSSLIIRVDKVVNFHEGNRYNAREKELLKLTMYNSSARNTVAPTVDSIEMEPIPGDKHIIFIETRCLIDNSDNSSIPGLSLFKRQACVIESAANMNHDYKVYLLYSCPINGRLEDSTEYVKSVLTHPNIRLWRLDIKRHFSNTPLEKWDFEAAIGSSEWPREHSSDVLRFLTLWKYGGTYLDLDVVILKSLDDLKSNYVGLESNEFVASCVLNFDYGGIGHAVAGSCLEELRTNFRGDVWNHNGPGLITRVLLKKCHSKEVPQLSTKRCKGIKILSSKEFFPIPYESWELFFNEYISRNTMDIIKDSYGVHLWNKLSKDKKIIVRSKQPYNLIAAKACPRMYSVVGNDF